MIELRRYTIGEGAAAQDVYLVEDVKALIEEHAELRAMVSKLIGAKCTCMEPQKWTEKHCPIHDRKAFIASMESRMSIVETQEKKK